MKLLLFSILLSACASKSVHKVTKKEEHFKSPRGGSIDVEIRIAQDKKNQINPQSSLSKITLKSGAVIPEHSHTSDEYLHFTKGNGEMIIAGEKIKIHNNRTVLFLRGLSIRIQIIQKEDRMSFKSTLLRVQSSALKSGRKKSISC